MLTQELKYREYFDVDEKYFPCIDESAINSGAAHKTLNMDSRRLRDGQVSVRLHPEEAA